MAKLRGPDIANLMKGAICAAVGMAVKAGYATAGFFRTAVIGLIELLLRKRRQQQPQSFKLLRVQDPVEERVVVVHRDQLALRDIAEIRASGQIDRRRKLR